MHQQTTQISLASKEETSTYAPEPEFFRVQQRNPKDASRSTSISKNCRPYNGGFKEILSNVSVNHPSMTTNTPTVEKVSQLPPKMAHKLQPNLSVNVPIKVQLK